MAHAGIHHVTAIAGDASRNLGFYARVLGMRLVKRTVNFDDPGAYHLYYGDEAGTPGTILTFFPWAGMQAGTPGAGELAETMLRVPRESLGWWAERLRAHGAEAGERFGETVVSFRDPDGLRLALVGVAGVEAEPAWGGGGVGAEHAIRGFHGVSLSLGDAGATAALLGNVFGYAEAGREDGAVRMRVGEAPGGVVDLRTVGAAAAPGLGRGSVHHLAFRAADDAAQAAMVAVLLRDHGVRATGQRDRDYFRSVYFREPGGVLFEIATDAPGFAVDEDPASLGTALKLPAFLRPHRARIEAALPALA